MFFYDALIVSDVGYVIMNSSDKYIWIILSMGILFNRFYDAIVFRGNHRGDGGLEAR